MSDNVCVVEVVTGEGLASKRLHFWPYKFWDARDAGDIEVDWWPKVLADQLDLGLYIIRRVTCHTKSAVRVGIKPRVDSEYPATWIDGSRGIAVCQRFLNYLGVKLPDGWYRRYFYLKVTKI